MNYSIVDVAKIVNLVCKQIGDFWNFGMLTNRYSEIFEKYDVRREREAEIISA